jgi:hypothetical protein
MENTGSGLSIGLDELISHDKQKIKMEKNLQKNLPMVLLITS